MDISNIASQTAGLTGQNKQADNNKLGQEQFLQLLVAQMKNQDPVNPMDGKEFASQLAQFNSVEQLIGVKESLSAVRDSQEVMRTEMTTSMAAARTSTAERAWQNEVHIETWG